MTLFTSSKEKRLWMWALAVLVAIFSTLFVGKPLAEVFSNQDVQAVIFLLGMLLVGATIIVHAVRTKSSKAELAILLGIVAVYMMLILRLGIPERSHLIEYGVLAIFVHKALVERSLHKKLTLPPALLALMITFLIGVLDECIQLFLPNRVFDPEDIVFNGMAVTMALGANVLVNWVQKRKKKA